MTATVVPAKTLARRARPDRSDNPDPVRVAARNRRRGAPAPGEGRVAVRDLTVDIWPNDEASTWEPFTFPTIAARDAFAQQAASWLNTPMRIEATTKVWQMCLAWMDAQGHRRRPGFTTYMADLRNHVLPVAGDLTMGDCTLDVYRQILSHAADHGESRLSAVTRTVGAVRTWVCSNGWPNAVPPFGHDAAIRKAKRDATDDARTVDLQDGRTKVKINIKHCPTFEDLQSFRAALAARSAAWRWKRLNLEPSYLGEVPFVQYVCGHRLGEVLVAHANHFDLDAARVHIDYQLDERLGWGPTGPQLALTKSRRPRTAAILEWARDDLAKLIDEARRKRDGWLFPPPGDIKGWDRSFSDLHKSAAETLNYRWTSHWHRHAYASYLLAPITDGGYGRSLRTVSDWLGHSDIKVTADRYWHPVEIEAGWSLRTPGTPG